MVHKTWSLWFELVTIGPASVKASLKGRIQIVHALSTICPVDSKYTNMPFM